jgi:hypothetical protein
LDAARVAAAAAVFFTGAPDKGAAIDSAAVANRKVRIIDIPQKIKHFAVGSTTCGLAWR